MKLYRTENTIINLENVRKVEFEKSTSQHTCKGEKYLDYHYSILISYMEKDTYTRINLPDNNETFAKNAFETIFEILNK